MRQIGTIRDQADLQRLVDYLLTLGIRTHFDEEPGGFVLWGVEEDKIDQARGEVAAFLQNPGDPKYGAAAKEAQSLRAAAEKRDRELRKLIVPVSRRWNRGGGRSVLTLLLTAACIAVALTTSFAQPSAVVVANRDQALETLRDKPRILVQWLSIAQFVAVQNRGEIWIPLEKPQSDVRRGQVWRLITPIFLHFALYHLVFNVLALWQLGQLLETRYGGAWLLVFVVVTAVASNLAQYQFGGPKFTLGGPTFGGMSGVVYAMFGFAWIRGKFDPSAGFRMSPSSVFIMLLWLVVCFTGTVGSIANMAHLLGLVAGAAWGGAPIVAGRGR